MLKHLTIQLLVTSFQQENPGPTPPPENSSVTHIAVILDGVVEETIQCQNRLAALLLSEPEFIEYNPNEVSVFIGSTEYNNGKFFTEEGSLMTNQEIAETIEKMGRPTENKE